MAEKADNWIPRMKDWARPHVDGEPEAVALLTPAGSMAAAGLYQVSGLAGMLKNRSAKQRAGGLGKTGILLAKTADKLYAFDVKPSGMKWKVKSKTGEWPLSEVRVSRDERSTAHIVTIDIPAKGEHYELEATKLMSGGINDPFLDAMAG